MTGGSLEGGVTHPNEFETCPQIYWKRCTRRMRSRDETSPQATGIRTVAGKSLKMYDCYVSTWLTVSKIVVIIFVGSRAVRTTPKA